MKYQWAVRFQRKYNRRNEAGLKCTYFNDVCILFVSWK